MSMKPREEREETSHERYRREQRGAAQAAKDIWTPCKHFSQCIGYCPYCIAEKMMKEKETNENQQT